MAIWEEIENEGRKTKWDFDLYNSTGQRKLIFTREIAESGFQDGFVYLEKPKSITGVEIASVMKMVNCDCCGMPTKVAHLRDGLCPECGEAGE